MNILVTGGAGFIGSRIVDELLKQGHFVKAIDNLSKGEAKNLIDFKENDKFEFVQGDLLDIGVMLKESADADMIYHLAAKIGGIGYFHKIPASLLKDNTQITLNVFEAAKERKIKVVYLSSSMVYEGATKFPVCEEHLAECALPTTAYGFSKLAGEYIAKAYHDEFGVPFVVVRPFNAYGPGELAEDYVGYSHVIPDFVKKMVQSKNNEIEILGDGEQTRCFTYVDDLAEGIVLLGMKASNEAFNIGSERETKISELAQMIWKIIGKSGDIKLKSVESYKDDVRRRVPNCGKIRERFGWEPKTPLEDGLKRSVEWLMRHK